MGAAIGFIGGDGQGRTVSPGAPLPVTTNGRLVPAWDHRDYSYDGETQNFTSVIYRLGGPSGAVVATQAFAYDAQGRLIGESWS